MVAARCGLVRRRPLPSLEELHQGLDEAGVTDAPRDGPDEECLRALLDLALFVAEHRKSVAFPGFTWADPGFTVTDAKVTFRVAYAELAIDVATTLAANLDRLGPRTLLALDAHRTPLREFDLGHDLYGRVTLFQWPHKPPEPADPRISDAMEKGWARTLKEHNLTPGRGIVVLDEHQGLLLRDPRLRALVGTLLLLEDGQTRLWWNPFCDGADSELQYWLTWGAGTGLASAWKEQLFVEERDSE
jgi:hypothetical protein